MAFSREQTPAQVAEGLAQRAVVGQGLRAAQTKFALSMDDVLGWAKANPTLAGGAIGATGGALFGGLSSLAQDPEDRQTGRGLLTGAMAGGAAGLGIGHLAPKILNGTLFGRQPLEDDAEQKLQQLNQQGAELNKQWEADAPTLPGSVAQTAPVLGGVAALQLNQNRLKPIDIREALGDKGSNGLTRQSWDVLPPAKQREVLRYGEIYGNGGKMPWWRQQTGNVAKWLKGKGVSQGITDVLDRSRTAKPPHIPASLIRNLAEAGRDTRLKLEGRSPYAPTGSGLLKNVGIYAGIPLAYHYLVRNALHQLQQPT